MVNPLPQQIKNLNEAYDDQFRLVFKDLREMTFHCQVSNLPGVSQVPIRVDNNVNYMSLNATKLFYEDLAIKFKVDEDLNNYQEVYAWLVGITSPQRFEQFTNYQALKNTFGKSGFTTTVDASLIQLTQMYNANIEIVFVDVQPVSLSGLNFQLNSKGNFISADAVFRFDYYYFKAKTS